MLIGIWNYFFHMVFRVDTFNYDVIGYFQKFKMAEIQYGRLVKFRKKWVWIKEFREASLVICLFHGFQCRWIHFWGEKEAGRLRSLEISRNLDFCHFSIFWENCTCDHFGRWSDILDGRIEFSNTENHGKDILQGMLREIRWKTGFHVFYRFSIGKGVARFIGL